ncbi:MAG: hypothetical protein AAFY50_22195, partial [Cyanobacteria bacterium J06648_1]
IYLESVTEKNDAIRRADISNEVFSALPNLLCFMRTIAGNSTEPITKLGFHLAHVATDTTAAIVTVITGGILIAEAGKALKEAKAAS